MTFVDWRTTTHIPWVEVERFGYDGGLWVRRRDMRPHYAAPFSLVPGFVRSLDTLVEVLERDAFAGASDATTYRETLTFFNGGKALHLELPWTNPRGDVDIIELHDDYALSVIRKPRGTAGSPTFELESRLGVPATTRTLGTIQRLAKTFRS